MANNAQRLPRLSIALLSATALAYEVLLTRLFSIIQWHHFAFMIISLALLGYGASGTFLALSGGRLQARFPQAYLANVLLFGITTIGCFLLAQQIPFNPQEVLWDRHQLGYLLAIYLLLALPFFFAANAIGLALLQHRQDISRLYAADLLGAGLGSVAIVLLLFMAFPMTGLRVLAAVGMAAAALAGWELRRSRMLCGALLALAVLPLLLPAAWTPLQLSPYKGLSQTLQVKGSRLVAERSSPLGLLSVVASPEIPLRHAPGLSLLASQEPPPQIGVFTDGDGMTVINRNDGDRQRFAFLDALTSALPYHLRPLQRVLVLGAGGGSEVLQALYHGVPEVHAVELNPQMVQLVRRDYARFAGSLYTDPRVHVHVAEARGFVAGSTQRYDLIQVALLDSFNASAAGLYALNESYLYTVEALQEYVRHLQPDGYLAITRWLKIPPRDSLKLFATAVTALARNGRQQAVQRVVMIRSLQTSTLLIKNGAFGESEIAALQAFCAQRAFDMAYYPGMPATAANRYNQLRQPMFYQALQALAGPRQADFMAQYKFNITPASDDRPYFFNFFKWSTLPEIVTLAAKGGMPFLEWGYLVLVATLLQALLISVLLIVLPLWLLRRPAAVGIAPVQRWSAYGYFLFLGLAFLFLEMAFIQKFLLFLHHPLYAIPIVLTAFLVFAGLGSAYSQRYCRQGRQVKLMRLAVLGIVLVGMVYLWLLDPVLQWLLAWPTPARAALSLVLIAPLAFCMGMPFPLGLSLLGQASPRLLPWAWGINGCASVLSAVLATLLAIHFGFAVVLVSALGLYALASLVVKGFAAPPVAC
jgi:spermidine synthase